MIKKALTFIALTFFLASPASAATTLNVPFMTWENGKTQSIVLGGPGVASNWKMQLEGEGTQPLQFSRSQKNAQGSYIYTLDVPKNLTPGGYVIQAIEGNGTKTVVAGVQIKARETYRITEIPSDLRLLAVIFAAFTALFTTVRSRKYSRLTFMRRDYEAGKNFIYRFRNERLSSEGVSLARYVALRSGEPLHRISPALWSLLPWVALAFGAFTAIQIQFDSAIPQGPLLFFFICAALGALDATTGIALALGLGFVHVALGNVTNLRSLFVAGTFTLAWYLPSFLAALIELTLKRDLGKLSFQLQKVITFLSAGLTGGAAVILSTLLTDSLVINRESDAFLRWPLAGVVAIVITLKYFAEDLLSKKVRPEHSEDLYMARVVSPSLAMTLFFATVLIVYVWTNDLGSTLISSAVIAAPYFLLFVVFPKLARFGLGKDKRNLFLEVLLVVALTNGVYFAIQMLPMAVINKSRAFILLGLIPALVHAIYSVFVASSEYAARKDEMEAMA